MSYSDYLKQLLRPLGVYQLEGSINGSELDAYGIALDGCAAHLEETEREMNLVTAEGFGLDRLRDLLRFSPAVSDIPSLRTCLAALLRIGNDSFTLDTINDTIIGCGAPAVVHETARSGVVQVTFPAAQAQDMDRVIQLIEEIIPCHLLIDYLYSNVHWSELPGEGATWGDMDNGSNTWLSLMLG